MYTHCPNCDTHFEISQEYLDIANGKVRCGKCDHIFNALDNLYENAPESIDNSDSTNNAIEKLNPLQGQLSSNIDNISTTEDTQNSEKTEPLADTSASNFDKPLLENTSFTIPSTDIKEKMERIAASLSAATAELKNARKSTSFQIPSSSKTNFEALFRTDSTQVNEPEESVQTEKVNVIEETTQPEEVEAIEETIQSEKVEVIEETTQSEEVEVIEETTQPEEVEAIEETIQSEEVEIIEETTQSEEVEAIEEPTQPEDELDLVDFTPNEIDDSSQPTTIEHNTRKFDDGDMDILNSLIEGSDHDSSSNQLLDELDDINKTLSDSSDSLDDEFSNLGSDFDDLDDGDDLLAELEQLENDFLHNKKSASTQAEENKEESLTPNVEATPANDESTQETNTDSLSTPLNKESHDEVVPSFLTQNDSPNSNPASMLGWLAGTIGLILLLGLQYLHVNSTQFSQNTDIRPILETLCPITNCSLPLIKTPRKIVTVSHDVRSHPKVNNALEIQLIFKNKATYTQGYPILEITFSNPLGEVIAHRKFLPDEYLTGDIQYARGLKANQSQELNLKIIDPDPGSLLSFQFNYL